jgi:hypothetical protein
VEQTRRDDLESLAYVLIYFLKGGLPWQNLNVDKNKRRQVIGDMKKNTSITEITAALPEEFAIYLREVRSLKFGDTPKYQFLRDLFKKCFNDMKFQNDGLYDWSQIPTIRIPVPTQTTPLKTRKRSQPNSIELYDTRDSTENKTPITSTRKRKVSDKHELEIQIQKKPKTKSPPKAAVHMTLRPRKNRRSTTTFATLEYDQSHEVIEISDDDS